MSRHRAPHKFANTNKRFFLVSAVAPTAVAHVHGGAAHNEANISIWDRSTHGHQDNLQWTLASAPDGGYFIQSAIDPHFVIHQWGANSDNDGNINLWDKRTHGQQGNLRVNFHDRGDGWHSIHFVHSNKCVHVHGAVSANDTNISQWDYVDQANLKWRFVAVKEKKDYKSPKKLAKSGKRCYLVSHLADHAVAHVHGGAAHNEAKISIWSRATHGHQDNLQWKVSNAPDGHYYIESAINTNFVIHQHGANSENNGAITLWDKTTHGHQGNLQLKAEKLGGGWYALKFAHSGKCVHVYGAQTADDTPISQWEYVDQDNLKWKFVRVRT